MTLQETIIAQLGVKPSIDPKEEIRLLEKEQEEEQQKELDMQLKLTRASYGGNNE